MSLEKLVRRTAQRVLQTIGIADKTFDDEFKASQQEFALLGEQLSEIRGDIKNCVQNLQTFAHAAQTVALHVRAAEATTAALAPVLCASSGENSEVAAERALRAALTQNFDSAHRIAGELAPMVVAAISSAALPAVPPDEELSHETAAILERRRTAQLDYDSLRRQASPQGPSAQRQHEERIEQARQRFEAASQAAVDHLQARSMVRASAIIASFVSVAEELERFHTASASALRPIIDAAPVLRRNFPSAFAMAGQKQPVAQQQQQHQPSPTSQQPSGPRHDGDWGSATNDAALLDRSAGAQAAAKTAAPAAQPQAAPKPATSQLLSFDGLNTAPAPSPSQQRPATATAAPPPAAAPATGPATATFFDFGAPNMSKSPNPVTQAPQSKPATPDTFGFGLGDLKPAPSPAAPAKDTLGLNLGSFAPSPSPATPKQPDTFGFGLGDLGSFVKSTSTPPPAAAAAPAPKPATFGDAFDSVFGAMPQSAPTTKSPVDDLNMFGSSTTTSKPPSGHTSPAPNGGKLVTADQVRAWSVRGGRQANMRALLSSLHEVLWEDSGWTQLTLADLVTQAQVREAYRKAAIVVHPDKVTGKERQEIAQIIFSCLRESYDTFKKEAKAQTAKPVTPPASSSSSSNVD